MVNLIKSKLSESLSSVLPIALIVLGLSVTVVPISTGDMFLFLVGIVCLVFGMSLFTAGAEMSMQPLGSKIGSTVGSSKKIWLIAFISFIIGILVTISEPDLVILAEQVSGMENMILILTVSVGVGIFLAIAVMRIVFNWNLTAIMIVFYAIAFVLAFFVDDSFLSLAFDSGGVTTGPMTVPFIMSIGAGVSVSKLSGDDRGDSFGITGLCSIGPIISVLVLGIVMKVEGTYIPVVNDAVVDTREGVSKFVHGFGEHLLDVLIALAPIIVFAVLFQLLTHAFNKGQLIRMAIGIVYVLVGLAIFLTGANVGFVPTGTAIGTSLAKIGGGWLLVPIGMLLGYFIVKAEPSVYVLNKLVETMSAGAISGKTTGLGLSIGVSAALGLAALRIITGINILWFLIPGYIIALTLSFFVPKIFVGISFDSGGVASGTMMSAFVLPLCMGACNALGGNVMTDAFGCVAFVAMAPIIAIQICGLVYKMKAESRVRKFVSASESFIDYEYDRDVRRSNVYTKYMAKEGMKNGNKKADS
ncbi:MAG: DUF1538 domain-containing protein [Clostridia bacterium]|nr:DUF1538 domain-containing protein [Clostridia bacterium]